MITNHRINELAAINFATAGGSSPGPNVAQLRKAEVQLNNTRVAPATTTPAIFR